MLNIFENSVGLLTGSKAPLAKRVYLNTTAGLVLVASVAAFVPNVFGYYSTSKIALVSLIPVFVIPLLINSRSVIRGISNTAAYALFFGYAACLGCILAPVAISYPIGKIAAAFGLTVVGFLFAVSQAKNIRTGDMKWVLYSMVGILAISLLNMFLRLTILELIICSLGIPATIAMTSWQLSQVRNLDWYSGNDMTRLSILLSLNMLINIVNLFMYILRLLDLVDNRKR